LILEAMMSEVDRFGELRSLLQQAPSQERFDAVVGVLSSMRRQDGERFDAEVFQYSRDGLERWYALCPLDGRHEWLALSGRVALAALRAQVSWLELMRGLDLTHIPKAAGLVDALVSCERLERLEALMLPGKMAASSLARVLAAPCVGGLRFLWMSEQRAGSLDALGSARLERLVALSLFSSELGEEAVRGIVEGMPELEVLDLGYSVMEEGQLERLLAGLRGRGLRRLALGSGAAGERVWAMLTEVVEEARMAVLDLGGLGWSEAALGAMCAWEGGEVEALRSRNYMGQEGAMWPLERLLGSPLGRRLRRVELMNVQGGTGAWEGSDVLEECDLSGIDNAGFEALCAARLPALRKLELSLSEQGWEVSALDAARLPALRELRLSFYAGSGSAPLWRGTLCEQLETLWLWGHAPMDEAEVALMAQVVERCGALETLYIGERLLPASMRPALRGTRAGELLGVG
jgi:hypothetical protein